MIKTIQELKDMFKKGSKITESRFRDLIDSFIHKSEFNIDNQYLKKSNELTEAPTEETDGNFGDVFFDDDIMYIYTGSVWKKTKLFNVNEEISFGNDSGDFN